MSVSDPADRRVEVGQKAMWIDREEVGKCRNAKASFGDQLVRWRVVETGLGLLGKAEESLAGGGECGQQLQPVGMRAAAR